MATVIVTQDAARGRRARRRPPRSERFARCSTTPATGRSGPVRRRPSKCSASTRCPGRRRSGQPPKKTRSPKQVVTTAARVSASASSRRHRGCRSELMQRTTTARSKEPQDRPQGGRPGLGRGAQGPLVQVSTRRSRSTSIAARSAAFTESDVNLARRATRYSRLPRSVRRQSTKLAEQAGVEIESTTIIYDALDDVKAAMAGLHRTIKRGSRWQAAELRDVFSDLQDRHRRGLHGHRGKSIAKRTSR